MDNYNIKKGIMYILMAAFSFAMMSIFVRLSGDLPVMQKSFFRNLFAVFFSGITLLRSGEKFRIQKGSFKDLSGRCIFGTVGLVANFYAIDHLRIADANMLNKLSPFFAMLMSIPLIKEIPSKFDWVAVTIAFTGALFVIKPTAGLASMPAFIGLASGFCAGTAYAFLRRLGKKGERGPVIVFCFSAFSTLVAVPFLIFDYQPMTWMQLLFLMLASLGGLGGQLSITAAYRSAPAKEISVFDYSQVIFAAFLGVLLFSEVPDIWSVIGYVMIIGIAVVRWHLARDKDAGQQ
jgi:drug/metabolite transporter (DMT)-like permease